MLENQREYIIGDMIPIFIDMIQKYKSKDQINTYKRVMSSFV